MQIVVPLAGPDFVRSDGSVKAEQELDGRPFLRRVLESRTWWTADAATRLAFVLHDDAPSRAFAARSLATWYPGCKITFISDYTVGAALSCLAGLAFSPFHGELLCLDLADILYDCPQDPIALFQDPDVGGVATIFPSDNPLYSYLALDADGRMIEAAEKRVISSHASAGTYFFRDAATYLEALAVVLRDPTAYSYRDLLFVCPVFNGVVARGGVVRGATVSHVVDVKIAPPTT
jgi:hypothetical protein